MFLSGISYHVLFTFKDINSAFYLYVYFVCYLRSLVWKWQPLPCSLWRARGRQWTQLTLQTIFLWSWSPVTSAIMLFCRCAYNAPITGVSEIWNVLGIINCLTKIITMLSGEIHFQVQWSWGNPECVGIVFAGSH